MVYIWRHYAMDLTMLLIPTGKLFPLVEQHGKFNPFIEIKSLGTTKALFTA